MKRLFVVLLLATSGAAAQIGTPPSTGDAFDRAVLDWDRGDFVPALEGFGRLLAGPDAAAWRDRVALETGELFQMTGLASDARAIRVSPSGRWAAFETGPRTASVTRLIDLSQGSIVGELPGRGLAFSPTGDEAVFVRVRPDPAASALRGEIERLLAEAAPDRAALASAQQKLTQYEAANSEIVWRSLTSGNERLVPDGGLQTGAVTFSADGRQVFFGGGRSGTPQTDIYAGDPGVTTPRSLTSGPGAKTAPVAVAGGRYLLYLIAGTTPPAAIARAGSTGRGAAGATARSFGLLDLASNETRLFSGTSPVVSADGSTLAFIGTAPGETTVSTVALGGDLAPRTVKKSADALAAPALAPDGSRLAFQAMTSRNWEIVVIGADGTGETRVTREIQHDLQPRFLTPTRLLAVKGEARHRRSYAYDLDTGTATRLFHNNTLRTIAPEYEWAPTGDGSKLLIVAERDGDTISPERGLYLLDFSKKVTLEDLRKRITDNLAAERALRAAGQRLYQPIEAAVRAAAEQVSIARIYGYEEALFRFDSKYITAPGNQKAAEYLHEAFRSFGYAPEYQTFTARGVRTSNVLATLRGTENPDLVYVVSSHFDSNLTCPGADDNGSATAVLLETARVLAKTPMPATVIFAAFTGEEAGLLGSREFVRQAKEKGLRLAGALNNDMIGWSNDHHLDNTIRYSNAGIRDLQHAAAFLFSRMVTYDAKYYKATDAAAYYEAYGDIVGGLGSYPVLGSPHYHQPSDQLEIVNHQLLYEAARFNVASIMRLAHGPSRVAGLAIGPVGAGAVEVTWTPSPEKGVTGYRVRYGTGARPGTSTVVVRGPKATLPAPGAPIDVAVRAIAARGLEGWDWARVTAGSGR